MAIDMIDSSHIDERDSVPVIVDDKTVGFIGGERWEEMGHPDTLSATLNPSDRVAEIYGPEKEEEEGEETPLSKFEKEEPEEST